MQVVGRGNNHRVGFHLVHHLGIVAEELNARRNSGLRLLNQFRVGVGNGHQFRIRIFQECCHAAPHVIVVQADDGDASLCRLGKFQACLQTEEKYQGR